MRIYWVLEKKTSKPSACSSIKALSGTTGMAYSRLQYQFGKKRRLEYETDLWRVVRLEVMSSKRKKIDIEKYDANNPSHRALYSRRT